MHGEKRPIHGEYLRFRKKGFFENINPQIESLLYKKYWFYYEKSFNLYILKDIGLQRFCYDLMNFKGVRCMVNSPYPFYSVF